MPKTKSKRRRNGCILSTSTTRECFPPVLQFTVKLLHVYLRRQQLKKQPQIVGAVEKRADSHTRQKKKKKIIRTYIAAHANVHTHQRRPSQCVVGVLSGWSGHSWQQVRLSADMSISSGRWRLCGVISRGKHLETASSPEKEFETGGTHTNTHTHHV